MQSKIIKSLKEYEGYLSGEELSRNLKISRAGIWKNIEELRREGYDITAVPHLGYKLASCPDKLYPNEIQFNLTTKTLGCDVIHYESIESTMTEAFKLGMDGAPEGTLVIAESQLKGKGRLGRSWASPKGKGIYMSIILRPKLSPTDVAKLTLLSAVAVCEAVEKYTGLNSRIKWPNDLLVNGKKLSGILTELSAEMDQVRFVVIGIGINVNTQLSQLPEYSTSIKNEIKKQVSRVKLTQQILTSLEYWYDSLNANGFSPVIDRWRELSSTLGQRIRIGDVEGEAVDLDEYGGLIIRNDSGEFIKRMTGDVINV